MDVTQNDSANETAEEQAAAEESAAAEQSAEAEQPAASAEPSSGQPAEDVPQPRSAEPEPAAAESGGGRAKKRKAAPKAKTAGTKSLVVFRDGKVHYADETVVVLDLDDAANPDTDVHDVVDKLAELRDAAESPGRSEAVSLVAELIQAKALA